MFFSKPDLEAKHPIPGVTLRAVWGDKTMLTIFDLEPGAVIPTHDHPHEQISYVLEGKLEFTLGNETRVLNAGDGVVVPSGVTHGANVLESHTKVVDGWYPIREDYR